MKNLILTLLLLTFCTRSYAQINLVPNPSFEDTLNCDSFQIYHAGFPWFTPTNSTPDYYYSLNPTCGNSAFQNPSGFQLPYDGNAYIGIYVAMPITGFGTRDYISIQLTDSLLPLKDYQLDFYVSRANAYYLATDDIGAFCSVFVPSGNGFGYLPYQPQVENPQGNIITDSLNWTKISGVFTAQGGEKYLTLGNFKDSINTTIIDADSGNGEYNNAYDYIDKVSLIPVDSLQGLNSINVKEDLIQVFPSLVNSGATILVNSKLHRACHFELYLSDARRIKTGYIHPGINQLVSDGLPSGVYILYVIDEKILISKKIVVY